ncbi:MAG: hypothetical protein KGO05_03180, partial [Chloroflexota bacterium]|nr:hypothetical protein [Chloroflexota bacterium]
VAMCDAQPQVPPPGCETLPVGFAMTWFPLSQYGLFALTFLPALAGIFLGAPLVARDLETGSYRLAWTQSVTRLRWLGVMVGLVIGVTAVVCAIFIPLLRWWNPLLGQDFGLGGGSYDYGGTLPVAYLVFALALGVAAGTLLRRTVPAMFATLVGYAAVRLPFELWARSRLVPPMTATWDPLVSSGPNNLTSNAWLLFFSYADTSGNPIDAMVAYQTCAPSGAVDNTPGSAFTACLHAHGWLAMEAWQPASRYWLFQGIESGIYLALAILLIALVVWWVRRRIA